MRKGIDNGTHYNTVATNLQRHRRELKIPPEWQKPPEQGAATSVFLAISLLLEGISGRHFEDCNEAAIVTNGNGYMSGVVLYALNPDNAERIWDESLRLLA